MAAFKNSPITAMLVIGVVTQTTARIWFRAPKKGTYYIQWGEEGSSLCDEIEVSVQSSARDFTGSVSIEQGLEPGQRYWVKFVEKDRQQLASGSFITASSVLNSGKSQAVALLSCHQPFDKNGVVGDEARKVLRAMAEACEEHNVQQIILCGDQLYSDQPETLSVFDNDYFATVSPPGRESILDCSAEEVRDIYHYRYRHFWAIDEWKYLLANYSCIPVLDDHDIVDNWGSALYHSDKRWSAFKKGSFQAYQDYQGSLLREPADTVPDNFDSAVVLPDHAIYVLDLRSNRCVGDNARVVSAEQLSSLENFLKSLELKQHYLVCKHHEHYQMLRQL